MGASECRCTKDPSCQDDSLTLFPCAGALNDTQSQTFGHDDEHQQCLPQELTALSDRPFSPGFCNKGGSNGGGSLRSAPPSVRNRVLLPGGATYEGSWLGVPPGSEPSFTARKGDHPGAPCPPQKHGQGTLVLPDGMRYCGQFHHDRKSGYGTLSYPSGCSYGGQWSDDLQNGHGTETWADGSHFEGQFKAGVKHGKGRFLWSNGCHYDGDFQNNDMHGEGSYTWSDGRMYSGQWRGNSMGPSGTMQWPDGRVYAGAFLEGRKHGEGTHWWPDGRSYRGEWRQGKQHGTGLARTVKGVECRGLWEDGKFIEWLENGVEKACPVERREALSEEDTESPVKAGGGDDAENSETGSCPTTPKARAAAIV